MTIYLNLSVGRGADACQARQWRDDDGQRTQWRKVIDIHIRQNLVRLCPEHAAELAQKLTQSADVKNLLRPPASRNSKPEPDGTRWKAWVVYDNDRRHRWKKTFDHRPEHGETGKDSEMGAFVVVSKRPAKAERK